MVVSFDVGVIKVSFFVALGGSLYTMAGISKFIKKVLGPFNS